jgi:hypothetical protein
VIPAQGNGLVGNRHLVADAEAALGPGEKVIDRILPAQRPGDRVHYLPVGEEDPALFVSPAKKETSVEPFRAKKLYHAHEPDVLELAFHRRHDFTSW